MDAILNILGGVIKIAVGAISDRNADVEASRAKFVGEAHELFNALRDLRASEKADHDAAIAEHLAGKGGE